MKTRGTEHVFSALAARDRQKAALRDGVTLLDIDLTDVATACDVNYSTAKAWASKLRDHAMPDWAMRRVRVRIPKLAAYLDTALADLGGAPSLTPASAECASKVLVGAIGAVLAAISSGLAGDDSYDAEEAAVLIKGLATVYAQIGELLPKLQRIAASNAEARGTA